MRTNDSAPVATATTVNANAALNTDDAGGDSPGSDATLPREAKTAKQTT